jgi:hypothetical protein
MAPMGYSGAQRKLIHEKKNPKAKSLVIGTPFKNPQNCKKSKFFKNIFDC